MDVTKGTSVGFDCTGELKPHPRTMKPLPDLPICFDEELHAYWWLPTNERLMTSVTGVCSVRKSAKALAQIEKTKHIWAPRGTEVHFLFLEGFLKGTDPEALIGGPYDDWLIPLMRYPLWESFEPMAIEYRVCDLRRNIGGSLDLLGYDHALERLVLMDVKTLGNSSRTYSTDAQLGGYLSMLIDHHKLVVDECGTVWAGKGECHRGSPQPADRCLQAWEDVYDIWSSRQEEI